jgi:transcriptional regulator with XRE-family HTH domain
LPAHGKRQRRPEAETARNDDDADDDDGTDARPHPQFRHWLRSRRASIQPQDVGLPQDGRRSVAGLTQAEVAGLAQISTRHYRNVEKGDKAPSLETLADIALALRLDSVETAHLLRLARPGSPESPGEGVSSIGLDNVVASFAVPTVIYDETTTLLASNDHLRAGLPELGAGTARTNLLHWFFTTATARDLFVDWADVAEDFVARLRVTQSYYANTQRFDRMIAALCRDSPEARRLWTNGVAVAAEPAVQAFRLRYPDGVIRDTHVLTTQLAGHHGPGLRIASCITARDATDQPPRPAGGSSPSLSRSADLAPRWKPCGRSARSALGSQNS